MLASKGRTIARGGGGGGGGGGSLAHYKHTHLETAGATILLLLCLAQQIQGAQGTKIANEARNYIYDRPCA
jgi:hypothetical protein